MIAENYPLISVIIPVKNEAALLIRCLDSLSRIDYPQDRLEVIVADGLSEDNTKDVAAKHGAKVVNNDKQVVVSGRNCGYKVARGEIIAFTDADCLFDSGWLKSSIKYFKDDQIGGVGGVSLAPLDSSDFERAVDSIYTLAEVFRSTVHRKNAPSVKYVKDIPGCNAIYRRGALEKVMPVEENFLTAEDVWMNSMINEYGYKLIFAPDVILWHYRRSSIKKFLRQSYRFAIGRLQVGKRKIKLLNFFHIVVGLAMPIFLFSSVFLHIFGLAMPALKIGLFLSIAVILALTVKTKSFLQAVFLPLAVVLFIFGWSAGFLRELFFPLKDVKGK